VLLVLLLLWSCGGCTHRLQAILNTMLSKVHIKKKAGFKPTEKTGGGGATGATAQIQSALMHRLTSLTRRFNQATLPQLYQPQVAPAGA
jgi:hypothetical protein